MDFLFCLWDIYVQEPVPKRGRGKGRTGSVEKEQEKILLIEDNPGDQRMVQETLRELECSAFTLEFADTLTSGIEQLAGCQYDAVLLDLNLPDSIGLETLDQIRACAPEVPVVIMTGQDDESQAVEALQRGAQDYQIKGLFGGHALSRIIRYAIERKRMETAVKNVGEYYLEFIERSNDIMFSLSPSGKFVYLNKRWFEVLGYAKEKAATMTLADILPPSEADAATQILRHLSEGKDIDHIETVFVTADGGEIPVAGSIITRKREGRVITAQGIFRNLSELRRP